MNRKPSLVDKIICIRQQFESMHTLTNGVEL